MLTTVDQKIIQKLNKGEDFWSFEKNCERDYVHGMFAYPAMMVPQMQREIIKTFKDETQNEKMIIFDPFMGSGTIIVEGMLNGADVIGVDINPLAYLVSLVKSTIYSEKRLKNSINKLFYNIDNCKKKKVITNFDNIEKWFKKDIIIGLDHIKQQIEKESCLKIRRYMWVAFCEAVRSLSNSRSSTYKLHIKADSDIESFAKDPIEIFKEILLRNFDSTISFQKKLDELGYINHNSNGNTYSGVVDLRLGDTLKETPKIINKYNPSIIITSPPYGDNHTTVTYGQYSVLALRWMNINDISSDIDDSLISTLSEIDKVSLGGDNKKVNCDKSIVLKKSEALKKELAVIKEKDKTKISKIVSFYEDFYNFIEKLKKTNSNTYIIMTVGNRTVAKTKIEMNQILCEMFSKIDYELVCEFKRNILNKRMPVINKKATTEAEIGKTMTKEYVLILKKR